MSQTPSPQEGMSSSEQPDIDQGMTTSQVPSPEEAMSLSEQPDIDQGMATSQTLSPEERMPPDGQLDIGPGGIIIVDSPNNSELLEFIERTEALSPIELYTLAVSYQQTVPNSDLGNRLGFIGLSTIFQNSQRFIPELYPQSHDTGIQTESSILPNPWNDFEKYVARVGRAVACNFYCTVPLVRYANNDWFNSNCSACPQVLARAAKRVNFNRLKLLIEVTQIEESKTYTILGVSPS